jgi:hypothetical protein
MSVRLTARSLHSQRLRAVRSLPSVLKKPVYKRGDAPNHKVGRFRLGNSVFSLGYQVPLPTVSEDTPVVSAAPQS